MMDKLTKRKSLGVYFKNYWGLGKVGISGTEPLLTLENHNVTRELIMQ